jgi:hypothetical protein
VLIWDYYHILFLNGIVRGKNGQKKESFDSLNKTN